MKDVYIVNVRCIMTDQRWRLLVKKNDVLGGRYQVLDKYNSSSYSNVYLCKDLKGDSIVVIKAYRKQYSYENAAHREMKIMQILNEIDHESLFVRYLGCFRHKQHMCLIIERYGPSLYDAFVARNYMVFNMFTIKSVIYQVAQVLGVMHRNGMIHTDVKLENILLPVDFDIKDGFDALEFTQNSQTCSNKAKQSGLDVRLIDFGSYADSMRWHKHTVTSENYRAPEILMGLEWGIECDIWSLGCLTVEMALGDIMFGVGGVLEHLFTIQHMIAPFPQWMCDGCSVERVSEAISGNLIMPSALDLDERKRAMDKPALLSLLRYDEDLTEAALKMLEPDPFKRISADKLLELPFFKEFQ